MWFSKNSSLFYYTHMHNITLSLLHSRNTQQGSAGEGGSCVGPRVDLPLHCYLLLGTKGPLGELRQEEKPGGEWVSPSSTEKKTLVSPPWPLCHPWILFTPREVFSLIDPPGSLFFASRSHHIHRDPSCLLFSASSFSLFPFFYRLNQERCSPSIANWLWRWTFITWWLGVCLVEMWESERVGRGMWAHPQGHHYDETLHQCHGLHTRFTGGAVRNQDRSYKDNWLMSN